MVCVRIATWNLWWRFGDVEARMPVIERTLLELDADVVGLQEVADIPAAVGEHRHIVQSCDADGEVMTFGNAIVSRWPIVRAETKRLPNRDGEPGPRTALLAVLDGPQGDMVVACTHLDWQYDGSMVRQNQLLSVCGWLSEWRAGHPSVHPPVLLADLNAVPESDEFRRLVGLSAPYVDGLVFTDSWAAVGEGDGYTWTRNNPNSADAQWPRRRLDHVLIAWPRSKPTGNPIDAQLFGGPEVLDGVLPSDHTGVVVTLDDRPPFPDVRR